MANTSMVHRMALESPACPEHAGMELSRSGGIWLSKRCMLGLGWIYKLCLLSRLVGSGTLLWLFCHLSCIPRVLGMLPPP